MFVPFLTSGMAASSKQRLINNIYRENEYCRFNVKKFIALAFISVDDVVTAFDLVAQQFDDDADDLIDYFEKTWIGPKKT